MAVTASATLSTRGMTDEPQPAVPESADAELTRLRRLAAVDELLTTLVETLDLCDVFTRVSDVVGARSRVAADRLSPS